MKNITIRNFKVQKKAKQSGSILLEALIAILIFSFGLLAISGLQGAMMKNNQDATYRAEASYIVQQKMGAMLANPMLIGTGTESVSSLPNGNLQVLAAGNGRLQFIVTWNTPGRDPHNYSAVTSIFTAR